MILNALILIFIQPIVPSLFFCLAPLLDKFFKNEFKKLNINLIFFSLISDFIFIKPLGFFLFSIAFSFLFLTFLEKLLAYHYFYQIIIYLILFNTSFILFYFYFGFKMIPPLFFFIKILMLNLIYQLVYLLLKIKV